MNIFVVGFPRLHHQAHPDDGIPDRTSRPGSLLGVLRHNPLVKAKTPFLPPRRAQVGKRTSNVVPTPSWLVKRIDPWWARTIERVMARPSPAPPLSRDRAASDRKNLSKILG